LAYSYAIVYIDDVLIVANSKEEAFTRWKDVLKALSDAGFSFNIKKCTFFKTEIEYLGVYIKNGEIKPNPRKIEALSALTQPTHCHAVKTIYRLHILDSLFHDSLNR